jgi:hypothetical protein
MPGSEQTAQSTGAGLIAATVTTTGQSASSIVRRHTREGEPITSALRNWLRAPAATSWWSSPMSGDSRVAVSSAVTERSIRLVEAKASALVSIMARRAGAESARLPGIEISRGTAYAGIADVKVRKFDH